MAEKLILRLGARAATTQWALVDQVGNRIGPIHHESLGQAAERAPGRRVIVLVPMSDITLSVAELPTRNTQKILQAVPYALEEQVAEDIDELHFALGARTPAGAQRVAIVRHATMQSWLGQLSAVNIEPDALIPEALALPIADTEFTLAVEADKTLIARAREDGFAVENTVAPLLLGQLLEGLSEAERPTQLRLLTAPGTEQVAEGLIERMLEHNINYRREVLADVLLAKLIGGLEGRRHFNLLQGRYRKRGGRERYWRAWRTAAALTGMLLILISAQQGLSYTRAVHKAAQRRAAIQTIYHRTFPDARLQRDPTALRAEMAHRLTALRQASASDTGGFLDTLATVGKAMTHIAGLHMKALSYRNSSLQLNLHAPGIPALDNLKHRLAQSGAFEVTIQSANANGKGVDGRLTIKRAGE